MFVFTADTSNTIKMANANVNSRLVQIVTVAKDSLRHFVKAFLSTLLRAVLLKKGVYV